MGERGVGPKSLVKGANGCRELSRCSAVCLCSGQFRVRWVRWSDAPYGMPCLPFYRTREGMGYNGGKEKNQRELKAFRIAGSFFSFMQVPPTL